MHPCMHEYSIHIHTYIHAQQIACISAESYNAHIHTYIHTCTILTCISAEAAFRILSTSTDPFLAASCTGDYVCMYVCMHVCAMYVCVYVCMYVCESFN